MTVTARSSGLAVVIAAALGTVAVVAVGPLLILALLITAMIAAALLSRPAWFAGALTATFFASVLTAPLARVGGSLASAAQPLRSVLVALLVIHAARVLLDERAALGRALLPVLLVGVTVMASALLHEPPAPQRSLALPFAAMIVAAGVHSIWLTKDLASLREALHALGIACGAIALIALVLLPFLDQPVFLSTVDGPRFQGPFENPNSVGLFGFVALPALASAAISAARGSLARTAYLALAALAGLEVLISLSRTGIAATLVALATLALIVTVRRPHVRMWAILTGAGVFLALATSGVFVSLADRLRLATILVASGRREAAQLVTTEISRRPWFGHGYGSEEAIFQSFGDIPGFSGAYSGNIWLDATLELGLVGCAALAVALAIVLKRTARIPFKSLTRLDRRVAAAFVAIALGGLMNAQGESFALRPGGPGGPAFWIALGVCSTLGLRYARAR